MNEDLTAKGRAKRRSRDKRRERRISELGGEPLEDVSRLSPDVRVLRIELERDLKFPFRGRLHKPAVKRGLSPGERAERSRIYNERYKAKREASGFKSIRQPWHRMYLSSRQRAVERGLPFDLSVDLLKELYNASATCPLLDVVFSDEPGSDYYRTIDRVDSSGGYVKGNIQIISKRANTIKSYATLPEFRTIYLNWSKQQTKLL